MFEKYIKTILCHDNWFSNLTYWMYKDLECTCCAFYRGICLGIALVVVPTSAWCILT